MLTFHENMSVVVVQVTTKYVSRIWQLTKINLVKAAVSAYVFKYYTGYFTSDNEPNGNENATQNTFPKYPAFLETYCGLHFRIRRAHYHS
jgi:hypothetical protein